MHRFIDIWQSFRAHPLWVQFWVFFILGPVNLGALFFLDTPEGRIAAALCLAGMIPNLIMVWMQRGLSRGMAFPHLPFWTPLVIWLAWTLFTAPPAGALGTFLVVLLVVDTISLAFDYVDAWKWLRGDRQVTRPALSAQAPST
jgi:hypothetical protein